jgi:hypothetical protein
MRRALLALCLLVLSVPLVSAQALFDTGRDANTADVSVTSTPNYFRGGLNFAPVLPPAHVEVFRGQARAGDFCNFDLVATMRQAFEDVPELLIDLAPLIVLGVGIHFLCATFPEQCSLAKDIKNYANLLLRFERASCYQVVESASYGGVAASDSALGECLRASPAGESSQAAWARCQDDRGGYIPLPNGGRGTEVDVLATILETAGVPDADAARIQGYTGRVVIFSRGNVFATAKTTPTESALTYYIALKTEYSDAVAALVDASRSGTQPSPSALNALSVPGVPLPLAAIESIAGEVDANLRAYKIEALAAALALAKAQWDLTEDLHTLDKAIQASEMTPDQEKAAQDAVHTFRREIARLEALKGVLEDHYKPAVDALLEARAAQLQEATIATALVQRRTTSASRYANGQTTFGYAQ